MNKLAVAMLEGYQAAGTPEQKASVADALIQYLASENTRLGKECEDLRFGADGSEHQQVAATLHSQVVQTCRATVDEVRGLIIAYDKTTMAGSGNEVANSRLGSALAWLEELEGRIYRLLPRTKQRAELENADA